MTTAPAGWAARLWAHRRRVAPLVLGGAVLVVGGQWQSQAPGPVEVEFALGPTRADASALEVDYLDGEALVRRASFRFEDGAPSAVRHRVELGPGHYEVVISVTTRHGPTIETRAALDAPADGVVRLRCGEGDAGSDR
jgi:hypothetical protein